MTVYGCGCDGSVVMMYSKLIKLVLLINTVFWISACEEEDFSQTLYFENGGSQGPSTSGTNNSGTGESGSINGGSGEGGSGDGGSRGGYFSDFFTQDKYTEEYDFLWVIDNSGSMSNIRTFMSQNLSNFVSVLESRQSLDWQMAVTVTDHVDYAGNLVSGAGGVRVVNKQSSDPAAEWQSIITSIPNTTHSGWEQGLESGYAAIDKYGNEFNRSNVPLIVTYVSDEEDYSCESDCSGFTGLPENKTGWNAFDTSRYNNQFAQLENSLNVKVIIYPIVHLVPLGQVCDDDYGFVGARYIKVQQDSASGASLSLCADQLEASFNRVAQLTANRSACFKLTRTLITTDGIEVRIDNHLVQESAQEGWVYELSDNSVCFSGSYVPQNGARIEVSYKSLGD